MKKLKTLYTNYIARRHCKFTFDSASNGLHINYSISPIWRKCPLYDEIIIRQHLISIACYSMGVALSVPSFVYDGEVSDD